MLNSLNFLKTPEECARKFSSKYMFMFETHLLLSVGDCILGWREKFGDSVINKIGAFLDSFCIYWLILDSLRKKVINVTMKYCFENDKKPVLRVFYHFLKEKFHQC